MDIAVVPGDRTEVAQYLRGIDAGALAGALALPVQDGGMEQGLSSGTVLDDIDQLVAGHLQPGGEQMETAGRIGRSADDRVLSIERVGIDADDTGDADDDQEIIGEHPFPEGPGDLVLAQALSILSGAAQKKGFHRAFCCTVMIDRVLW